MTEAAVVAGPDPRARLLAACQAKASDSVDGTFYLSGRMAGKVAGLPRNTAVRLLDALEDDGDLIVVERGRPSPIKRRATYYRIGTIYGTPNADSRRKKRGSSDPQQPKGERGAQPFSFSDEPNPHANHQHGVLSMATQTFQREVDEFSRTMEFFTETEIEKQIGHARAWWPAYIVNDAIDNGLDAAESEKRADGSGPIIEVRVDTDRIVIADNGPGIDPMVLKQSLNFATRTSDKAAYVSPTRGRQGNALKTMLAAPFVVDGEVGVTEVTARGIHHVIAVRTDQVEGEPVIDHKQQKTRRLSARGSEFVIHWPDPAAELTAASEDDYLAHTDWAFDEQDTPLAGAMRDAGCLIRSFALFNPHASFTLDRPGQPTLAIPARRPAFAKWRPDAKIPAHWYHEAQFINLIASVIRIDKLKRGRVRSVREFLSDFKGLTDTAIQKDICRLAGLAAGTSLDELFIAGEPNAKAINKLLKAMKAKGTNVEPKALGVFGRETFSQGLRTLFDCSGDVRYAKAEGDVDGVPWNLECVFGIRYRAPRLVLAGVNWSPRLRMPFEGLADILQDCRVMEQHPVVLGLHLAFPGASATDRGKSRYDLPVEIRDAMRNVIEVVTKKWQQVVARSDRRTQQVERRDLDELRAGKRASKEAVRDAAFEVMAEAYLHASSGVGMANARQVMYAARPRIIERTGNTQPWKDSKYFTQKLLPEYLNANPDETASWDIIFDERGHYAEPHTKLNFGIGTLSVRHYIEEWASGAPNAKAASLLIPHLLPTIGPINRMKFVLFTEKEGFDQLFHRVRLAERFDLGMMSTKGMTVTACRRLIDALSGLGIVTLVLHDFDQYGLGILHTMRTSSDRYKFENKPLVQGLGLRLKDVQTLGLIGEEMIYEGAKKDPRELLSRYGASEAEQSYLVSGKNDAGQWSGERVELNAPTAGDLVRFVESKLIAAGATKVVPDAATLSAAYQRAIRIAATQKTLDDFVKKVNDHSVVVPSGLAAKLAAKLVEKPEMPWDTVLFEIAQTDSSVGKIRGSLLGKKPR